MKRPPDFEKREKVPEPQAIKGAVRQNRRHIFEDEEEENNENSKIKDAGNSVRHRSPKGETKIETRTLNRGQNDEESWKREDRTRNRIMNNVIERRENADHRKDSQDNDEGRYKADSRRD